MIYPKNGKKPYLRKGHLMSPGVRLSPNFYTKDFTYHPSINIETQEGNKPFSIRRLVYHCFVEPIELHSGAAPKYFIIPKDKNGLNTYYKNLARATKSEIELSIYKNDRIPNTFKSLSRKERVRIAQKWKHKKYKAVSQYDKNGEAGRIYSFPNKIPKTVKLNEIGDYIFFHYSDGDIAISNDNTIYFNSQKNAKISKLLMELVDVGKMSEYELLQFDELTEEDRQFLSRIKETGTLEEWRQLANLKEKIGVRNFIEIFELGSQSFQNDGAEVNSGYEGEKIVFADIKKKFGAARVKWTSNENPKISSGTNEYDFEVYDELLKHIIYFVDAKSTTLRKYQTDKTEIFWRNSEWKFLERLYGNSIYLIARVFDVNSNNPEITYIKIAFIANNTFP